MTQDRNTRLRDRVSKAWPPATENEPAFDAVWLTARQRHAALRRRYQRFAGVAAMVAAAFIVLYAQSPSQKTYIEMADLMESTYWTAPSDVLLPQREFDIYQDMPAMFESTEPAGGTLL
jgi:hypothetical protein